MKRVLVTTTFAAFFILVACKHSKQTSVSPAVATPPPVTATDPAAPSGPSGPAGPSKSTNGIFSPGNEELIAIRAKYPDVTAETLNNGYSIYTFVCTNCHRVKSIYSRSEEKWPGIIDDMAPKSNLTLVQKDAVLKYVLAIKATQPK